MLKKIVQKTRLKIFEKMPVDKRYNEFTELWKVAPLPKDKEVMLKYFGIKNLNDLPESALQNYVRFKHTIKPIGFLDLIKITLMRDNK